MSEPCERNQRPRCYDQPQVSELLEELCDIDIDIDIDVDALDFSSESNSAADESFFDAETIILEWDDPPLEVVDTDRCVKMRFPDEVPEEVLEAHLRHYTSGKRGISPVVRHWCMCKFSELYPGAPCFDFDLV